MIDKYRIKLKDEEPQNTPKLFIIETEFQMPSATWMTNPVREIKEYVVAKTIKRAKAYWQNVNNRPLMDWEIREIADPRKIKSHIEKGTRAYDAINHFNQYKTFPLGELISLNQEVKDSKLRDGTDYTSGNYVEYEVEYKYLNSRYSSTDVYDNLKEAEYVAQELIKRGKCEFVRVVEKTYWYNDDEDLDEEEEEIIYWQQGDDF